LTTTREQDSRGLLVSFATADFSQARLLLEKSARRFGLQTRIYGPDHAVIAALRAASPDVMSARRGAGYWLWKPHIILDAMNTLPEGRPVFYVDVAMTVIADPWPLIAQAGAHPVILFGSEDPGSQARWTKRDCFIEMDADTPDFWNLSQLMAGFQLYRNGPQARAFLEKLAKALANRRAVSDDPNSHGLPNLTGFRDHRHDQSILTILAAKEGMPILQDPSQFGPWDAPQQGKPFGQIFHLHRIRNKRPASFLWRRLRRAYTGGRRFL
jgi:hypothetical protein